MILDFITRNRLVRSRVARLFLCAVALAAWGCNSVSNENGVTDGKATREVDRDAGKTSVPQTNPGFYVSPSGADTNAGTVDAPFLALAKARDAARSVNKNMTEDIRIYLRGGVHVLPSTLTLDQSDSGTNGRRIIYQAYPGERPVVSGGTMVTGWSLHDAEKNIYKATVGTSADSRQLYVNGVRAIRARSVDGKGWKPKGDGYDCPPEVASWRNPANIEVAVYDYYMLNRGPVQSVSGSHAIMATPYWTMMHRNARGVVPAYIENAYELLDAEGEWYLDRAEGILYYKPRTGEDMAGTAIFLPRLETLVQGSNVSNISFQGLTFSHATWLLPSTPNGFRTHGFVYQDNLSEALALRKEIPGNLTFRYSKNILFEGNIFEHLGGAGLELTVGCKSSVVHDNIFRDISASGVSIGSQAERFPSDEDWVKDITFDNNLVEVVDVEYESHPAVYLGFTEGVKVVHNEIRDIPMGAVTHGGYSQSGYSGSRSRDNHIDYNYIHEYNKSVKMHDGGAIYVIGTSETVPVSTMSFNHIDNHDVPLKTPFGMALYMDNFSQGWQANSNVVNIPQAKWRYWLYMQTKGPGATKNVSADNNYTTSTTFESAGNPITNTHCHPDANWPTEALDIIRKAGRVSK